MKILHIIDSGGLYGAEAMLINLAVEQKLMGLEPIIASIGELGIPEKPLETDAGNRCLRVEKFRMRPGPNIVGTLKVLKFARREGIAILHSHGYKSNIMFGLLPWTISRIPIVSTLHGWTWSGGWNRMRIYEWLDRMSLRFIDRVVIVDEAMRSKVGLKNIHLVNNGIPLTENSPCECNGDGNGRIKRIVQFCLGGVTVGAVGRLSPEKGFDVLLEAVKKLSESKPAIKLVILGEGDERENLEVQVKRLGLEGRVLMPGYVANAGRYIHLFKVLALSSLTEGLPIVILEAMRAGVPIVATSVGGLAEVLENGKAGILIEPGNSISLAKGISESIDRPVAAAQRADNARLRLKEKYSSQAMAEKYFKIYLSVLQITQPTHQMSGVEQTL